MRSAARSRAPFVALPLPADAKPSDASLRLTSGLRRHARFGARQQNHADGGGPSRANLDGTSNFAGSARTARSARRWQCRAPVARKQTPQRKRTQPATPPTRPLRGMGREAGFGALPEPETALMRAVLEDAILCYLGRGRRRRMDPRILAREAEFWILRDDWESPFSFNNVCTALGLCVSSSRREILAWRDDPTRARRSAEAFA
jgi:hypothetical protein